MVKSCTTAGAQSAQADVRRLLKGQNPFNIKRFHATSGTSDKMPSTIREYDPYKSYRESEALIPGTRLTDTKKIQTVC